MTAMSTKVVVQAPNVSGCSLSSVQNVYMNCVPPKGHNIGCQMCWGVLALICPGSAGGFCFGCCYGCDKSDCCTQCCASYLMSFTAPCIIGWYVSCLVGLQLLDVDISKCKPK